MACSATCVSTHAFSQEYDRRRSCPPINVNTVVMRTVSILYDSLMAVGCFSHTVDHVGEKMNTPILEEFIKSWISLFAHNPKARVMWRTLSGLPTPSFSLMSNCANSNCIH